MESQVLDKRPVIQHAYPDRLSNLINKSIANHKVRYCQDPKTSKAYLNYASLGDINFSNLCFGTDTLVEGSGNLENYYIQLVLDGTMEVSSNNKHAVIGQNSLLIINPYQQVHLYHSAQCSVLIARIPRELVNKHLVTILGHTINKSVQFDSFISLEQPGLKSLSRVIHHLCDELNGSEILNRTPLIRNDFTNLFLNSFLVTTPNSFSDRIQASNTSHGPEFLLIAEKYMYDNLSLDITLEDIAQAANSSTRNLLKAFRKYRDTTPMRALKVLRLQIARRTLESNLDKTITEVAMSVGINHLGHFAADYQTMFGELPSATKAKENNP